MQKELKVLVTGATGLVGSHIVQELKNKGYTNILSPTSKELNLVNGTAVRKYFQTNKPEWVFHCAGKVGGIIENRDNQALFLSDNLLMGFNVINVAYLAGVNRLLNMGSACMYPKSSEIPLEEHQILEGYLEPTCEGYAIAKTATLKLCSYYAREQNKDFFTVIPPNLYGRGDTSTHVIPELIKKFHTAKLKKAPFVTVYGGSNIVMREFMHVADCAAVCVIAMEAEHIPHHQFDAGPAWINIGNGEEVTIRHLVDLIRLTVGYEGKLDWDFSKPTGTLRRVLSTRKMQLNLSKYQWKINLLNGLRDYYEWFKESNTHKECQT